MQVNMDEIPLVARLVDELCGVVLDESKGYLIESRLGSLAREAECASFAELCQKVGRKADATLASRIVDAITTGETLFFRDGSPFEALRNKCLPDLIDAKSQSIYAKRIRIWSAAASTGQEPYSIAMTLSELIPDILAWDVNILATDISDEAIRRASLGRYAEHEIRRGMPPRLLPKYFRPEAGGWRVGDEIRSLVTFQRRNLLKPFDDVGPFDVIFCRNVAIYFDEQTKRILFNRMADRLTTHGYLFVGSSESLADLGPRFVPQHHCRAVFYQPNRQTDTAMA